MKRNSFLVSNAESSHYYDGRVVRTQSIRITYFRNVWLLDTCISKVLNPLRVATPEFILADLLPYKFIGENFSWNNQCCLRTAGKSTKDIYEVINEE